MAASDILIISGTNRPNSFALRIAKLLEVHYRSTEVATQFFSLAEMPREIFDPGSYASKPQAFLGVQQRILDASGLHIVTPEYNGSFPGVLKYFVDMLKFPESFDRKPVAFVGEAAGIWGGLRSVEQLQHIFGYRNAHIYPERVFIPGVQGKFDGDGNFTDTATNDRLKAQVVGFAKFVKCFGAAK
jgi:NAD(P)H-dependent FMN reductase